MRPKHSLLNPKLDVVFKLMFASRRGRKALIALLNAALKPASKITKVKVLNPEIPKILVDDKGTELDILAKLEDGTLIDVEMQMSNHTGMAERAFFYASRMYASELRKGHTYEGLRPVIVLFFLATDLFLDRPRDFHVSHSLKQDDDGPTAMAELQGQMQIHFFEIPKAYRLWHQRQLPISQVGLGEWMGFFQKPDSPDVAEACMSNPELKDAKEILEMISEDVNSREIARMREKARLHWDSLIKFSRDEGRAEGELAAKKALLHSLLTNPLPANLPHDEIAKLCGLSVSDVESVR